MKTICFINNKGGVGKTTMCAHIAYALTHYEKKRILCIDFDAQANLTEILAASDAPYTISDVLSGSVSTQDAIYCSNDIYVLAASMELANTEYTLTANNTQNALKHALEAVQGDFDYVFIDCPPSLSILPINALIASTDVCIVSNAEYLSLRGLTGIVNAVNETRMYNPVLAISSVVVSHYDTRKSVNREVLHALQEEFDSYVLIPPVRSAVAVVEASSHGGTVFQIRPNADVINDFKQLSHQFLQHYEHNTKNTTLGR